jgi:hypothetical protein
MSTSTAAPVVPPATHTPGGTLIPLPTVVPPLSTHAISRISTSSLTSFGLPTGIQLPKLNGANYAHWASTLEAILTLQESEEIIYLDTNISKLRFPAKTLVDAVEAIDVVEHL